MFKSKTLQLKFRIFHFWCSLKRVCSKMPIKRFNFHDTLHWLLLLLRRWTITKSRATRELVSYNSIPVDMNFENSLKINVHSLHFSLFEMYVTCYMWIWFLSSAMFALIVCFPFKKDYCCRLHEGVSQNLTCNHLLHYSNANQGTASVSVVATRRVWD